VSSVNFVDIIVFAIVCIAVVVSICETLCSFTSDTALNALNDVLVCRIRKWKRISNVQTSLIAHTHTHTHTLL